MPIPQNVARDLGSRGVLAMRLRSPLRTIDGVPIQAPFDGEAVRVEAKVGDQLSLRRSRGFDGVRPTSYRCWCCCLRPGGRQWIPNRKPFGKALGVAGAALAAMPVAVAGGNLAASWPIHDAIDNLA